MNSRTVPDVGSKRWSASTSPSWDSGSGNVVVPADSDQKVALIEEGTFGGTCVNRGCIPSKMLAYTADLAMQVRRGPQFGLQSTLMGVEWPAIRDRVAARVAETSNSGRQGRKNLADFQASGSRFISLRWQKGGTRVQVLRRTL